MNIVGGKIACQDKASYTELISNLIDLQLPVREKGHVVRVPGFDSTGTVFVLTTFRESGNPLRASTPSP